MTYLLVALGGALGSLLRYALSLLIAAPATSGFPLATLSVNVLGCFVMGLLAGYGAFVGTMPESARLLLMVGILGGFTTFSAFSLDVLLLTERGALSQAVLYIGLSVLLSLFAVFAGLGLVKALS